jgi:hypothetical protein
LFKEKKKNKMKLWNKLKELHNKIDLSKKYPKYINKHIFWVGFIIFIFYVSFVVFFYGFNTTWSYVTCYDVKGCENPYIKCQQESFYTYYCEFYLNHECKGKNCENQFISYKDYIGTKPPVLVEYFNIFAFMILLNTLGVNHLVYLGGKK